VLKESTKVDNLCDQIKEDLKMWNYIDYWESDKSTYNDDPIKIDYVEKLNNKKKPLQWQNKHNNNEYNKNSIIITINIIIIKILIVIKIITIQLIINLLLTNIYVSIILRKKLIKNLIQI